MTFFADYKDYLKNADLADITIKGYLADAQQFAGWLETATHEPFDLAHITPSDVREYRGHLQNDLNLRASTVNRKLASLISLLNWAVDSGRIPSNPAARIKYVNKTPSPPRWLDKNEQFSLQRAIEKGLQVAQLRFPKRWLTRRRDASLVIFMLHTGLRLSECTALTLEDIELSSRKGQVLIRHGKGNKERIVPLDIEAREALLEWLKARPECKSRFLWVSVEMKESADLTPRSVQRVLKRYGREAGIPQLTAHVLRHTFAKNLVNRKVGVEVIASLLGHGNLNTTQIYIKPNFKDLQKALDA